MSDEEEKNLSKQETTTIVPNAAILLLLSMLLELKVNEQGMTFEGVAKRVEALNETSLGQSNTESLRLLRVMMNEVRLQDA